MDCQSAGDIQDLPQNAKAGLQTGRLAAFFLFIQRARCDIDG
jgi:hypothetical protein